MIANALASHGSAKIRSASSKFGSARESSGELDNDLLLSGGEEQVIEMSNGCICCTVRGDLVRILGELRQRRERQADAFNRVIIETTGPADPAPVAQTFFIDEEIAAYYALDAIVTVVDAKHASQQLDDFHEAQEQVGFADCILLSKSDLVSEADRDRLSARLRHINPARAATPGEFWRDPDRGSAGHRRLLAGQHSGN